MNSEKKKQFFLKNEEAVLGLPMRLTISLIIGTIVLLAILTSILNPCLFPQRMLVSISPQVTMIQGIEPENISIMVFVNDTDGVPLSGAAVIIRGLGGAGSGFTDTAGKVMVSLQVQLEQGTYEGYLDVSVKLPRHISFEGQDSLKIAKRYR
jgi:hypothetical protein